MADGVSFSRAKLIGRQRNYTPVLSAPTAETEIRRSSSSKIDRSNKPGKRSSGVERDKKTKSSASSQKSKKASKSTSRKTNLRSEPAGEQLEQLEPPQENSEEAKQRLLKEKREDGVHSSQQKIQVVGLNG